MFASILPDTTGRIAIIRVALRLEARLIVPLKRGFVRFAALCYRVI